jgi:hypothetical protein
MSEIEYDNIDINLRNLLVDTCDMNLSQVELIRIVNQLISMVLALQKSVARIDEKVKDLDDDFFRGWKVLDEKVGQLSFDLAELSGGL